VLRGVTFASWSFELDEEARTILDEVGAALVANEEVRVRVNGHTDSTGGRAENLELSQNRAESVMNYLIELGVAADRLEAQGFGPDVPAATNDTAEGRQLNRRVELERIDPGD
jgi:OOP family OmpA-OmpF porin